jgi:hypothetical protein
LASTTRTTTDHDEIRSWVEDHGGAPATVRFETFDESDLAFLYQEQKADGSDSTFFKLVRR